MGVTRKPDGSPGRIELVACTKVTCRTQQSLFVLAAMLKKTHSEDSLRQQKKPRLDSPHDSNLELSLSYPERRQPTPKQTPFQQPSQFLSFSYDSSHQLEFTNSALRYFTDPPRGANLAYGYERRVMRQDDRGRIDGLLQAFARAREMDSSSFLQDIGVISWRGVMTKYACCLLRIPFWLTQIRLMENIDITL